MGFQAPGAPGPPGPGGGGTRTTGDPREHLYYVSEGQGDDARTGPSAGGSWPTSFKTLQRANEHAGGGEKCIHAANSRSGPFAQRGATTIVNEGVRGGGDRSARICAPGWSFNLRQTIDASTLSVPLSGVPAADAFGNALPTAGVILRIEHELMKGDLVFAAGNWTLQVLPGLRGAYGTQAVQHGELPIGANIAGTKTIVCAVTTVLSRPAAIGDAEVYLESDVFKVPKIPARIGATDNLSSDRSVMRIRLGHCTVIDYTGKVATGVGSEVKLTDCIWRIDGTPARHWPAGTMATDHSLLMLLTGAANLTGGLAFTTQANFTGACCRTETTDVDAEISGSGPYNTPATPGYGGTLLEVRWGEHHGFRNITAGSLDRVIHAGLGVARMTIENARADTCQQTLVADKETWGRCQATLSADLSPTGQVLAFAEIGSGTAGPHGRALSQAVLVVIEHPDGDEELIARDGFTRLLRGINGSGTAEGVGRNHLAQGGGVVKVQLRSGLTGGGWDIRDWKAHEGRQQPRAKLLAPITAAQELVDLETPVPPTIRAPSTGAFRTGSTAGAGIGPNESQTVTRTTGPLTLALSSDPGQVTADLGSAASAAAVQSALEALPAIGRGNVKVTGVNGGPYTVEFVAGLGQQNVPALTATGATVAVVTEGDLVELVDILDIRSGPNGPRTRVVLARCPKRPTAHPASSYLYLRCKVDLMAGGVNTEGFDNDEGAGSVQAFLGDNGRHDNLTSSLQSHIVLWGEGHTVDRPVFQLGALNLGKNRIVRPTGAIADPLGKAIIDELPDGSPIQNIRGSTVPAYINQMRGLARLRGRAFAPEVADVAPVTDGSAGLPHVALPDGGAGNVHVVTHRVFPGQWVNGFVVFLEQNGAGATGFVQLALIGLGKPAGGLGDLWELLERWDEGEVTGAYRIDASRALPAQARIEVPFPAVNLARYDRVATAIMTHNAGAGALFRGYRARGGGAGMYGTAVGDDFAAPGIALAYTKGSADWGGTGSATWNGWSFHSFASATPAVLLRRAG